MSRLGSSRNVHWSEKGATKRVYTRTQNLVNIFSFRSRYFDERSKEIEEKFFQRNEEMYVGRIPKASYFMTETLIVQK